MSPPTDDLPDVARILGPLLQRAPAAQQPILLAAAERLAAQRYRVWAAATDDAEDKAGLLACAAREEAIASRAESLDANAADIQAELMASNPDLAEINETIFAGRPLRDQFTIQARGERAGAGAWAAFAEAASDPKTREAYLENVPLEEENAVFLESLLTRG